MSSPGYQNIHVHLPSESGERIDISRRYALLTMDHAESQRALIYRER